MLTIDTTEMFPYAEMASRGLQRQWISKSQDMVVKEQLIDKFEWRDDLVDVIASAICKQLSTSWFSHIHYEPCEIIDNDNRKSYGRCYRLPKDIGEYAEMYKALIVCGYEKALQGVELLSAIFKTFETLCIRTGKDYLTAMFLVDYLLCNHSRDLGTFGIAMKDRINPMHMYPVGNFEGGLFQGLYKNILFPVPTLIQEMQYNLFGCSFQQAMVLFMRHTNISSIIPSELDVTGLEFPDDKAVELFCIQCKSLNIITRGVV